MISSMSDPAEQGSVAIPLNWGDASKVQTLAANQLAVTFDSIGSKPDLVVLTIGHAAAPILIGSEDQKREAAEQLHEIVIQPVARVSLSSGRLKEWLALLQRTADMIEEIERREGE